MASNLDNVKVEISVVLGRSVIPMHQLLRIGRGAVIELDSRQDDPVTVLANDKPVAKGEIQIRLADAETAPANDLDPILEEVAA